MNGSTIPGRGIFDLQGHGTSVRTELLAGVTTFMTMAYIILVNVLILSVAIGQDEETKLSLATATCISAALASLIMGLWANYPIGLAPGMGINAFFVLACTVMGVSWQTALISSMHIICLPHPHIHTMPGALRDN